MLVSVKREGGNWTEERDGTTLGHGDSRGAKCRGKALSVAVDGQVIHLYVIHLYAPFVYTSRDAQNAGPLGNVSVTTVWRLIPSLSVQWSTHFFLSWGHDLFAQRIATVTVVESYVHCFFHAGLWRHQKVLTFGAREVGSARFHHCPSLLLGLSA